MEAGMGELGVSEHAVGPRLGGEHRALSSPDGKIISQFTGMENNSVTANPRENLGTAQGLM